MCLIADIVSCITSTSYLYLIGSGVTLIVVIFLLFHWYADLTEASETPTRKELVLLSLLLLFGLSAVYTRQLAGIVQYAYADWGSDTADQYIAFYLNLADRVSEANFSLWNPEFGLGVPVVSYQSWLFDPFNILLVPLIILLGHGRVTTALCIVHLARIILVCFLIDRFLCGFISRPISRILASFLYSFSGFMIMWGQHYWLGTAFVMYTFLTLALELYLQQMTPKRFFLVVFLVFLQLVWSVYIGLSTLLFEVVYVVIRIYHVDIFEARGARVSAFFKTAFPVFCGLLLSGIIVLPYSHFILIESPRVSNTSMSFSHRVLEYASSFIPFEWVPALFSKFLGTGLINTGSAPSTASRFAYGLAYDMPYEFLNLGFSFGAILLVVYFISWIIHGASHRSRISFIVVMSLVLLYCTNFFLPALSSAFLVPRYRSSYTVCIPISLALGTGFDYLVFSKWINKRLLIPTGIITALVLAWSLHNTRNGTVLCIIYLCMLVITMVILCCVNSKNLKRTVVILFVILASSSVADAITVVNFRAISNIDWGASSSSDVSDALSWINSQNNPLCRVDMTFRGETLYNDALTYHFWGVSAYNSSLDGDVARFYTELCPEARIFSSDFVHAFGETLTSSAVGDVLGVRYLIAHKPIEAEGYSLVYKNDSIFVYQSDAKPNLLSAYYSTLHEYNTPDHSSSGSASDLISNSVIIPNERRNLPPLNEIHPPSYSTSLYSVSDSHIAGTIANSRNAVALLALPYTQDWHVRVDGNEVDTFPADYGFCGFNLLAGNHSIDAYYYPSMLRYGIPVTALGLLLTSIALFHIKKVYQTSKEQKAS